MPAKIFFCYTHEDEALLNKLKTHLRPLQRQNLIDIWYDRNIGAGSVWEEDIKHHLNEADIILLLISPSFIDSDYCYSIELQRAIERHKGGNVRVIPIILEYVYWQFEPLSSLQALPTDAKPIMGWSNQNEAFFNVAAGVRKVVEELRAKLLDTSLKAPEQPIASPILTERDVHSVAISPDGYIMRPMGGLGLLRVEEGKEPGREYKILKESLSIGRSRESDIFLEDLAVSRLHASVVNLGNGLCAIKDEGSPKGTKVNGQLVNKFQAWLLQEGDRIQIGQTVLVFSRS